MNTTSTPAFRGPLFGILLLCSSFAAYGSETGDLDRLRQRALELVNQARSERGLEPLSQGAALDAAAQAHAEDMLRRDYYAHASPEGDTVMDRYGAAGGERWRLTAENIARCRGCPAPPTPERIESLHQGWMNSPPHRENIVRRGLDRFGFGIVVGADQTLYSVQTFAGPGLPRDLQPNEEVRPIGPDEQMALALERINKERQANGREPLNSSPALAQAASNLLPERDLARSPLDLQGGLAGSLPNEARSNWQSFAALVGQCGGCGVQPTAADVRFFIKQWLNEPRYRERLLSPDLTHFGFRVRANGEGLKAAAAVLGDHG